MMVDDHAEEDEKKNASYCVPMQHLSLEKEVWILTIIIIATT